MQSIKCEFVNENGSQISTRFTRFRSQLVMQGSYVINDVCERDRKGKRGGEREKKKKSLS